MKFHNLLIAAATLFSIGGFAQAADTHYQVQQLGHELTRFGAIKAGNQAGTIPAYSGGLKVTDPAYNEQPFPFASEKPRLVITAKNMAKYADKLDQGTKALLRKFPNYHLNVYPTHRTTSYPEWLLKKTVE